MNGPRHDADAERAILGAAMLDHRIIDDCEVQPTDFYRPEHEALWAVITREHRAGRPVDPVALTHRITNIPGLTAADLAKMYSATPTAASAPYYAKIVTGLATLRRTADTLTAQLGRIQSAPWDQAAEVVENARAAVDANAPTSDTGIRTFHEALLDAIEQWENPKRGHVHPTGWPDLDKVLNGGWRAGHFTIVGARPAVGKSLIAGCAAVQAAERNIGVGFFALEMTELEVVGRMAAHAEGIQLDHIEASQFTEDDWHRIARLVGRTPDWPLYLDTTVRPSMAQIRAKLRSMTRRGPVPLVVIDYLQLVKPITGQGISREREVSRIAEDCKQLAREFNTHVLALAQVGRGPTQRNDKRPTMSDLRESGGQEAHADEVILLHRDDEEAPGEIELNVEKNRHGPTRRVVLAWAPHRASALNMHREDH